jgi:hypothetical protein
MILLGVWATRSMVAMWQESRTGCIGAVVVLVVVALIANACESCGGMADTL